MHRLPAECLFFFISMFIYAYKFLSVINRYKPSDDLRGYLHPVDSRARDASRVSGALPAGVDTAVSQCQQALAVPRHPDRRRSPRLGSREYRIGRIKALYSSAEGTKSPPQLLGYFWREKS